MKIIVTGHRGFIGTYLAAELRGQGHQVAGYDLAGEVPLDINKEDLIKKDWVDKVYHLAALVDARGENVTEMAQTNIMASIRLFEKYGGKVVFASSCAVHYPTPYGLTKRAAEDFARLFGCGIVRLCNIYGYGGHSVVDIFRRSQTLTIAGDGAQLRTYASVKKAVAAFLACGPGETLILRGVEATVADLARRHPGKGQISRPASKWDIPVGVQVYPSGDVSGVRVVP